MWAHCRRIHKLQGTSLSERRQSSRRLEGAKGNYIHVEEVIAFQDDNPGAQNHCMQIASHMD